MRKLREISFTFIEATNSQFVLPFLFLWIWFRFEKVFHQHLALLFVWILIFFAILFLLYKTIHGKIRFFFVGFWLLISSLLLLDFVQLLTYRQYSETHFTEQIRRSTEEVKKRAEKLLRILQSDYAAIQGNLEKIEPLTPETVPIQLEDKLGEPPYDWGVYNEEGRLLAWNDEEVQSQETYLQEGSQEVSVVTALHQNFLKYKQALRLDGKLYVIAVLRPIAADYGIENQHLKSYNLLTDALSIKPMLLYNSQTSTSSPELKILNIQITKDFSISTLYEKAKYREFLENRVRKLHWWLELLALVFFICASIYLIFEFIGVSGRERPGKFLYFSWIVLFLNAILSAFTISVFSSYGAHSIFSTHDYRLDGFGRLFYAPGNVFFTSFFLLIVVFSLVLFFKKVNPETRFRDFTRYVLLFGTFFLSGFLLIGYYKFVVLMLANSRFTLIDFSFLRMNSSKLSLIFGMIWLDLSFVFVLGILFMLVTRGLERTSRQLTKIILLQAAVAAIFYGMFHGRLSIPIVPTILLLFAIEVMVINLSSLWKWFERINLLSRFFVVLLLFWSASVLFYFVRFHYTQNLQRSFIEADAAGQVGRQDVRVRELLNNSEVQLDRALRSVSIDPKIPDLAYRLWTRTDLARLGYKSAVEIFDADGQLLNRFSLKMSSLKINVAGLTTGSKWAMLQRPGVFGNVRKTVFIAVRSLPAGGYLTVQTLQDYENLAFVRVSSPFHQLFRPQNEARQFTETLLLTVYDASWQPIFVSEPGLTPTVHKARSLMRKSNGLWLAEKIGGNNYHVYFFRLDRGFASFLYPAISLRTHFVQVIDLFLFNLMWLTIFSVTLVLFFNRYVKLHFRAETPTRFSFFQKLLFAFLVFSMVPMLSLSLLIRNYVWERKIHEVTTQALSSFSVAARVVGDWLMFQAEVQDSGSKMLFSDELLEWIAQVIQQDVSLYFERYLIATSNRELYSAGLLGQQIQGGTYIDLFLKGQKYGISQMQIGSLQYLNVSGRIYRGRFKDEVITIPFMIDEKSIEAEIVGLREYMMLVGAGLILFAVFLGYFLANRFARPVEVLIQGTSEMSRGHLDYRIQQAYQDEFQQLVRSFNTMAASLDENQQTLERRRAYIENILNNITTAVISIDRTMNVTTLNPAALQMFRIPPDYHGPLVELLSRKPEWENVAQSLKSFLESPQRFQKHETAVFLTNKEWNFRLVYVPLFQDKEWNGAVVLIEDISDIIRSNRLSAWAEMARRVAHEVKNPLTPIQLAMEHLVKVYDDRSQNFESTLRTCSEAVLKQVKALRRLVSDFSQYGRAAVLNPSEVNMNDFLNDLVQNYDSHLPGGIQMESRIDQNLPTVQMDQEKIRGALMNIIENGLQAMNGEGKMMVKASRDDGFVKIEIQDTGRGVPPELLPRLFEPYFSTKTGGTGLGLSIARKNVEDHGGKIEVESEPQQGTTVTILLPEEPPQRGQSTS